jgi:hypothetical protein
MPTTQHGPLGGRPTHPPSCQRRAVDVLRLVFPQHVMALEFVYWGWGVRRPSPQTPPGQGRVRRRDLPGLASDGATAQTRHAILEPQCCAARAECPKTSNACCLQLLKLDVHANSGSSDNARTMLGEPSSPTCSQLQGLRCCKCGGSSNKSSVSKKDFVEHNAENGLMKLEKICT